MATFRPRITRIENLSDSFRLPRLGMVRLGIKVKSEKTGKEFPREVDYFVVPPEVQKVFGEKPKELVVMIPINDMNIIFPQSYKLYGSSRGLKCEGSGAIAYIKNDSGGYDERQCPCNLLDEGKCRQSGILSFMIPKISMGGVYQLRTGSYNSITDIQSGLKTVEAMVGRFNMLPLTLRRVPTTTYYQDKKQTHYTVQLIWDGDVSTTNAIIQDTKRVLESSRNYKVAEPDLDNPEFDDIDVIDEEDEIPQIPETTQQTEPIQQNEKEPTFDDVEDDQKSTLNKLMNDAGLSIAEKKEFWSNVMTEETWNKADDFIKNFKVYFKAFTQTKDTYESEKDRVENLNPDDFVTEALSKKAKYNEFITTYIKYVNYLPDVKRATLIARWEEKKEQFKWGSCPIDSIDNNMSDEKKAYVEKLKTGLALLPDGSYGNLIKKHGSLMDVKEGDREKVLKEINAMVDQLNTGG